MITPLLLDLSCLIADADQQARVQTDPETVDRYAEVLADGGALPPVVAFSEEGEDEQVLVAWLADGFHRLAAHRQHGSEQLPVELHVGGRRDAILYAAGANADHGLPRSAADKRRAVELLLLDAEWGTWSNRAIARQVRVSPTFVGRVREALVADGRLAETGRRKGADGRTIDTTRIGRGAAAPVPSSGPAAPMAPDLTGDDGKVRYSCPLCEEAVTLTVDGRIERHGIDAHPMGCLTTRMKLSRARELVADPWFAGTGLVITADERQRIIPGISDIEHLERCQQTPDLQTSVAKAVVCQLQLLRAVERCRHQKGALHDLRAGKTVHEYVSGLVPDLWATKGMATRRVKTIPERPGVLQAIDVAVQAIDAAASAGQVRDPELAQGERPADFSESVVKVRRLVAEGRAAAQVQLEKQREEARRLLDQVEKQLLKDLTSTDTALLEVLLQEERSRKGAARPAVIEALEARCKLLARDFPRWAVEIVLAEDPIEALRDADLDCPEDLRELRACSQAWYSGRSPLVFLLELDELLDACKAESAGLCPEHSGQLSITPPAEQVQEDRNTLELLALEAQRLVRFLPLAEAEAVLADLRRRVEAV